MPSFTEAIVLIFASLQRGIGLGLARHRDQEPLLAEAWRYAGRVRDRLLRLHALWREGKLRPPRPRPQAPTVADPRPEPKPRTPRLRLPRRRAWLLRYNQLLSNCGTQLRYLATQPEMAEFLAAVPRAARLVRPLLHMLATNLSGSALAAPPRPKKRASPSPARRSRRSSGANTPASTPTPTAPARFLPSEKSPRPDAAKVRLFYCDIKTK